ncbi:MAG: UDP-N-acetylglucosamine 4,6-dehydratase [Flavobacterium sp.]|nr:UDP-N-acetylglucosamine 4,6-dehydratase [Flavobacterium sp.]
MDVSAVVGRSSDLFAKDIAEHDDALRALVGGARFLVVGGSGSIGKAVVKEVFARNPKALHVVDISENNMVELVRDIRSTIGYIDGDFRTFALDVGSIEFDALVNAEGPYDYVLNLSALKHVRSEKDPFTLMRLIDVNIFNSIKALEIAQGMEATKYFCVSSDKATNPVNMMGASKRIMEMFIMRKGGAVDVSTARFANVAFSDGSLLHGFNQRLGAKHPIAAPRDVRRYFVTPQEAGQLCLLSVLLGNNREIFFPKLTPELHLQTFSDIAIRFLESHGYEPFECSSEDEARDRCKDLVEQRKWPCHFFDSDTTGEKDFEEFFADGDTLNLERFDGIGVIEDVNFVGNPDLARFSRRIAEMRAAGKWTKHELVDLFHSVVPEFSHTETGRNLDQRM